ncbi:phosphoribosyltransferase [Candidimonas sp. SYP-B2681]|uniref:phosphoribosyltransferase n=1 Tax=Candidimonas sp. SYP-B2681 TaxID=2497686 RepID=UPI000F88C9E0|nr:phosphoribosyltransferase [Candidimonas sp. SYP-B2681]RTZ45593.1 phosphoribosyltransferase [Candidimonas sp. SYP-B2681]
MYGLFKNRKDAGRQLGVVLAERFRGQDDLLILGLPRGGVPVAYEVAEALHAPLDVMIVRKLGVPQQKEYAMGAIASGGVSVIDQDVVRAMGINQQALDAVVTAEQQELIRREENYRPGQPPYTLRNKTVVLVDDGIATGCTMRAAIAAAKNYGASKIIVAAPVAAPETVQTIQLEANEVVCLATPQVFRAVGLWYQSFPQTSDEEVMELLAKKTA